MPRVKQLHEWNVSYHEAVAIQNTLRKQVKCAASGRRIKTVAGADASYDKGSNRIYASVAVLDFSSLELIEQADSEADAVFPYIPGLLSFREVPAVVKAFEGLRTRPDALICDGQGIAHPRRFGLASHLGVLFGIPTVGCAKSRLCGDHGPVGPKQGDYAPLKVNGRTVGAVLRTRERVKPVFVSVGHLINLRGAVTLVLHCCAGYRLPEPTRRAHHLVSAARKERETSRSDRKR